MTDPGKRIKFGIQTPPQFATDEEWQDALTDEQTQAILVNASSRLILKPNRDASE